MKKYIAFFRISFLREGAYRLRTLFHICGLIVQTLLIYFFWTVFSKNSGVNYVSYMVIVNLMIDFMASNAGTLLGDSILNGQISVDLLRPLSLGARYVFESLGSSLYRLLFAILPTILLYSIFFKIPFPNGSYLTLFVLSIIIGCVTMAFFSLIVGFFSFFLDNWWGTKTLIDAIVSFFSGALVPVNFFPNSLKNVTDFLPFKYSISLAAYSYTESISIDSAKKDLMIQILWLIILSVIFIVFWNKAEKKVHIYGG